MFPPRLSWDTREVGSIYKLFFPFQHAQRCLCDDAQVCTAFIVGKVGSAAGSGYTEQEIERATSAFRCTILQRSKSTTYLDTDSITLVGGAETIVSCIIQLQLMMGLTLARIRMTPPAPPPAPVCRCACITLHGRYFTASFLGGVSAHDLFIPAEGCFSPLLGKSARR